MKGGREMVRKMEVEMVRKFFKDDSGAAAVEYGLLVCFIATAIYAVVVILGGEIKAMFTQASDLIKNVPQ